MSELGGTINSASAICGQDEPDTNDYIHRKGICRFDTHIPLIFVL